MAPTTFKSSLNPHAREFVPAKWAVSTQSVASKAQQAPDLKDAQFPLKDLPLEMLSCVGSNLSGSTRDLASCLLSCKQLQAAMKTARVVYSPSEHLGHVLSNPANAHKLDALIKALVKYMPGTVSCNLSTLPLEHSHISNLAHGLPHLAVLDLSGCKKLQPNVTKLLQQPGLLTRLQCLNLQRCFQLTDACFSDLLSQSCSASASTVKSSGSTCGSGVVAGSSSLSKLQCIALSHLNLAEWPWTALKNQDSNAVGMTGSTAGFWQQLQELVRAALTSLPSRPAGAARLLRSRWEGSATLRTFCCSSLHVVALNNCCQLSVDGLVTLAVSCPRLEFLMLGGSTLQAHWDSSNSAVPVAGGGMDASPAEVATGAYMPPQVAAAVAASIGNFGAASSSSGLGFRSGQKLLPPALQQLAALLDLPAVLPWEVLAACCKQQGGISCQQKSCSCCCGEEYGSSSSSKARARKQLERSEPPAAALAAARNHALSLAYIAAVLPHLKAMEVTFMAPGVAGWLRVCIQQMQLLKLDSSSCRSSSVGDGLESNKGLHGPICDVYSSGGASSCRCMGPSWHADVTSSSSPSFKQGGMCTGSAGSSSTGKSSNVRVWELSCVASVHQALQMLQDVKHSHHGAGPSVAATVASLETALRCAANCSCSRGRSTALHLAAERGCAQHVSALMRAGAAVSARDSSGASPLFVAAEAGRASAVSVLLAAGADALVSNTAGETALYIASLRGHVRVVEVLLSHLSAAGVDWMQERLYGDAWTPLMAAAVANRVDVALCLLRAATVFSTGGMQSRCSQSAIGPTGKQSAHLYRSNNRQSLDSNSAGTWPRAAGVERLLAAENRYGQTALHIAARKGCRELLRLLFLYGAVQVAGQVVDSAGDTWTDVAKRHGHDVALRELLQQC